MPDSTEPIHSPVYGIGLKILSIAVFTAMATLIKASAETVPAGEAVFFRSFFAFPAIAIWLMLRGELVNSLKTNNPMGHFWRGLVGVTAMFLGFAAFGLLPFPEVFAIGYAAPLVATILAAMFLGERIRLYRLLAVFFGLIGVVIILWSRFSFLQEGGVDTIRAFGALVALLGAVFAAMAQVFVRKLVSEERTAAIVIYFSLNASLLSLATIPFGWVMPDAKTAAMLVAAGVLGGIGQILLTESYRWAETAVIASFEYTSMLMAIAIGYWLFNEAPTVNVLIGAALIVVAGLFILYRERQLGIDRARARKVMTPQG
jgi:drug/metabolite transporter (DMT)-like permease